MTSKHLYYDTDGDPRSGYDTDAETALLALRQGIEYEYDYTHALILEPATEHAQSVFETTCKLIAFIAAGLLLGVLFLN